MQLTFQTRRYESSISGNSSPIRRDLFAARRRAENPRVPLAEVLQDLADPGAVLLQRDRRFHVRMEFISRRRIPNRRFHDPAAKAAQDTGAHPPLACIRCEMSCYMQMGLNSEDADMTMPSGTETSRPPVPTTRDELLYRLRQQSLLGEFGRAALQTRDIRQILQRATELCAHGLDAPFAKVLEYMPDEKRLLIRAGVGWHTGTRDHVSL